MSTPIFQKALAFVLKWECSWPDDRTGQYSNDPDDPGSETRFGVDKTSHPNVDIKNLTYSQAVDIYWQEWVKEGCDSMEEKIAICFYNCCVNCGVSRAQKILALASGGSWSDFIDYQESFYTKLAANRPSLAKFLKGWLNRTADLKNYLQLAS